MIEVDEKLWPLLVSRFSGTHSQSEFTDYLERVTRLLQREEPYVCLVDARQSDGLSPEVRQMKADWMKRHDVALRKYCLGCAFVMTSAAARLSMNVVMVLRPMPVPYTSVPTLEAAAAWVAERFQASGHLLPAMRVRSAYGLLLAHPSRA